MPDVAPRLLPALLPAAPRLRAAAVLAVLVPAASLASYELAQAGDAAAPLRAALVTLALGLAGALGIVAGLGGGRYPHARLGLCNLLTMLRAAGIAALAGLLVVPQALGALGWPLVALAAAVLALDAADGWAARRSGLQSRFGARFDVEVDVAFALVMAALAVQAGKAGLWFMALGLLRPAFLLALALWPRLRHPLPEAMWRKRVAAVQMAAQVALLTPVIVPPASQVLAAAVLAGVALSFAVDLRWLARQRPGPG